MDSDCRCPMGKRMNNFDCQLFEESQNGRGWKGPLWVIWSNVQPPCWSRVTYSRLQRTLSRQVLNISREDLPGQPVPVLRHPQREEVLPHVQTEVVQKQWSFTFSIESCIWEQGNTAQSKNVARGRLSSTRNLEKWHCITKILSIWVGRKKNVASTTSESNRVQTQHKCQNSVF